MNMLYKNLNAIRTLLNEDRIWNEKQDLDSYLQQIVKNKSTYYNLAMDYKEEWDYQIVDFLKKLIKKDKTVFKKIDPTELEKLAQKEKISLTDWDIKDAENGSLVVFKPLNAKFTQDIEHLADWLVHIVASKGSSTVLHDLRGVQSLEIANQQADKYFNAISSNIEDSEEKEGTKTILQLPNGFRWVEVMSEPCLSREGKLMGHCVGGYSHSVKGGYKKIFSLRDSKNEPHVTIEFDVNTDAIKQIKGKENEPPVEKYWHHVAKFLELPFVHRINTSDYKPEKIPEGDMETLVEKKPQFASWQYLLKKNGLTEDTVNVIVKFTNDEVGQEIEGYDPREEVFIIEEEADLGYFIDRYKSSRRDNSIEYAKEIVLDGEFMETGDEHIDVSSLKYVSDSIPKNTAQKIINRAKKLYLELSDDERNDLPMEDETDFDNDIDESIWFLQNKNDHVWDELVAAYIRGEQSGAEQELSDDFWRTINDWSANYDMKLRPKTEGDKYGGTWQLVVPKDQFIKMLNDPEILNDVSYNSSWVIDNYEGIYLESPRYGWSGFDKDVFNDYLNQEADLD